jgi:Caspase domain/Invasion associated locus B (IalB) protein
MRRAILVLIAFTLAGFSWAPSASAAKRVALVIGNAAYEQIPQLKNPKNDAEAVAAILDRLGFQVVKGIDLNHENFAKTVRNFSRDLSGADAAVLFYAGHGLRVNDRNYLAPVDAKLESEADLDFEMVQLETILAQMEREARINIVLLDACRDNPLARNLARSMGTRSAAIGRGLARVETGIGTLIAFATQPDNVALDGEGEHSPFTAALLKHIETPGLDIAVLMREVRQDVIAATSGKQVPWDNSSLTTDFEFNPASAAGAPSTAPTPAPQARAPDPARDAWNATKDTESASVLEAFIDKFGDSFYASLAKARLAELKKKGEEKKVAVVTSPAPVAPSKPVEPVVGVIPRPGVMHDSSFNDWSIWSGSTGKEKICFASSVPTSASRKQREYTGIYITFWPESLDHAQHEISVKMGAPLKMGSEVTLKLGANTYSLFVKGSEAFPRPGRDTTLIAGMKKEISMQVRGEMQDGRTVEDTYSLRGLSAALERLTVVCH